jgi:hypothetical protein
VRTHIPIPKEYSRMICTTTNKCRPASLWMRARWVLDDGVHRLMASGVGCAACIAESMCCLRQLRQLCALPLLTRCCYRARRAPNSPAVANPTARAERPSSSALLQRCCACPSAPLALRRDAHLLRSHLRRQAVAVARQLHVPASRGA